MRGNQKSFPASFDTLPLRSICQRKPVEIQIGDDGRVAIERLQHLLSPQELIGITQEMQPLVPSLERS